MCGLPLLEDMVLLFKKKRRCITDLEYLLQPSPRGAFILIGITVIGIAGAAEIPLVPGCIT